ncbi:MAG: phosphatase PAP2 family protein [Smithellaceae bacterium]|nr:phosphatase PAP2 family protein [Smithellaceae bacterium]
MKDRSFILGTGIVVLAVTLSFLFLDRPIFSFTEGLSAGVRDIFEVITFLGRSESYLVGAFAAFIVYRYFLKRELPANRSIFVFTAIAASGILINIIKVILGRARPILLREEGLSGFEFFRMGYEYSSFPSGHATTVFALATAIYLLFPRVGLAIYAFALAVGASRVILGAHYLSDVLAGAFLGFACTLFLRDYFQRRGRRVR